MLKKFAPALLVLALSSPALQAETVAVSSAPMAGEAINPAALMALKDMGAYLQSLKQFHASTTLTGERVLADGQKLQHSSAAEVFAARPDKLKAHIWNTYTEREIFYDGKQASIYLPTEKYYSSVEFSGPLSSFVTKLKQRYRVEIPLADLFIWGTPDAPLDQISSAMNAGQDFIGTDLCNHYAYRQGNYDWQIWISTGEKPLPRKLVITNRSDEARPQSVSTIDWNFKPFKDSIFSFVPPKGSTQVEIHSADNK